MSEALKSFYDVTPEDIENANKSISMANTIQELEITDYELKAWEDGRPYLHLTTRVVGGEWDGMFGPRYTLSLGSGEYTDKRTGETKRTRINPVDSFVARVTAIVDGKRVRVSNPTAFDAEMFEEIGDQMKGAHFVATIAKNDNGYDTIRRVYALSSDNLPQHFTPPSLNRFATRA